VRLADLIRYTGSAVLAHRLRSSLTMLGIVIGIASVILLTSIGEGARQYILSEFTQFGTTLLQIAPGKTRTTGPAGAMGGTVHPLSLADAVALARLPGVTRYVPVMIGNAKVEWGERSRSVSVYGVNHDVPAVWKFPVRQGVFLPRGDPWQVPAVAVLGPKLKRELFGSENALGRYVRVSGQRFLVIGVMEAKGNFMGFDVDDLVYIPVVRARSLFNRDGLMEIDVLFANPAAERSVKKAITALLKSRHRGEEDFTLTTQTEMLVTLDKILTIVSAAVGGIGGISLLVGAIGILTMMWISVNERTREIGLAKALGATETQILVLYLGEAALLSTCGGALGLAAGMGIARLLRLAVPQLPLSTPPLFIALALLVSFAVGILAGVLPARRAARLDPVEALAAE